MRDFAVGDQVVKTGGDYRFEGVVVARVVKVSGVIRYVVEDDRGLLFIFSAGNLNPVFQPDKHIPPEEI